MWNQCKALGNGRDLLVISGPRIAQAFSILRLKPFDQSSESGRSKERYRRAALTTASSVLAKTIGLLASLISVPLTYRYLGAERYGIWMILISFMAAMSFADLGIGNGLMNAVSEAYGKNDRNLASEYVTSAFVMMFCIAGLLAIAGAIAYPILPWTRLLNVRSVMAATDGAQAFAVLFGSLVVNIPLGVIPRVQAGLQKGYASQIVTSFGSVLSLAGIVLVIWGKGSLAGLVFASVSGPIVATLINGQILFRENPWLIPAWHCFRRNSAQKILNLGLMFFVLQCAFAISFSSDNIVIAQIMGAGAVAVYAVPQKLFSFVSLLISLGATPLWPAYGEAIARGEGTWVRRAFLRSLWITLAITIPLSALLTISAPKILRIALGESLHPPTSLLSVLAVWAVVNSLSNVIAVLLNGAGVLRVMTITAVFASVSNLGLSILLTRRYGLMGVCLASIFAQMFITIPVCSFLIRSLFKKVIEVKYSDNLQKAIG